MKLSTTKAFDRLALAHKNRFKILQGGSSSSKSYSILQYLIIKALRRKSTKPVLVSIVAESIPVLRRGIMKDFFDIIQPIYDRAAHNQSNRTYKLNHTVFEFFSADSVDKLKGPRRTDLFINEANNIKYEAFYQLEMRTERHVYIDFNPTQEFWVHTKLIPMLDDNELFFDISTYHDNQFAPPASVKSIERRKYKEDGVTLTEYYKVYGLGQIGTLEGAIYENWSIDKGENKEWASGEGWVYGLDFGFSVDPTALIKVRVKNGLIQAKELLYEEELTNQDLIKKFKELNIPKNAIIYADSAEPKSIEEIRRAGYLIRPAMKGKDSVRAGIDWIKSRKIMIDLRSINLLKELRNYVWEIDKDGKIVAVPAPGADHLMDALRYALSGMIQIRKVRGSQVRHISKYRKVTR